MGVAELERDKGFDFAMAQAHLGFPSSSFSLIGTGASLLLSSLCREEALNLFICIVYRFMFWSADGGAVQRLARPLAGLVSVPSNGFSRSASSFRQGSPLGKFSSY